MGTTEEDYRFDEFIDGSEKLVGEHHLVKFKKFVGDYGKQLSEIENALDETLSQVWDYTTDPLSLSLKTYEQTPLLQLVKTDNKIFNKLLLVFTSLCSEIEHLKEQGSSKFYAPLKLYGEIVNSEQKEPNEGDSQIQFGKMLSFLQEVSSFVNRTYAVTKNIIQQLASLYNTNQKLYVNFKTVHFTTIFEHLCDLFTVLITMDEIITSNPAFQTSITVYKRMVKAIKGDCNRYNADDDKLWQVEKLLYSLKGQLLDGRIFQNCIEQEFDSPGVLDVTNNKDFRKEFNLNVRIIFSKITSKLGESNEVKQRQQFIGYCGLYVFYVTVFKDPSDKKLFKTIWETHKKIPVIHLYGDVVWTINDFFNKCIPMMLKLIKNVDSNAYRKEYIKQIDKEFQNRVQGYYLQVSIWMVRMESNLTNRADIYNIINTRIVLITQGIQLLMSIGNLFKETITIHVMTGVPLKTTHVKYLYQLIELIKAMEATFHRRSTLIGESIGLMLLQLSSNLLKHFLPLKNKLEGSGIYNKKSDAKLDSLAAVSLAIQMLQGAPTKERRFLIKLSLHIILQLENYQVEEIEEFNKQIEKIEIISDMEELIRNGIDCSYLYWSRTMLPSYFNDVYNNPQESQKLQYLFAGIRDIVPHFKSIIHADPNLLINTYENEVRESFNTFIIKPLCRDIETDLRLHIHAHLSIADRNPWKNGLKDLAKFCKVKPLRFFDKTINIASIVCHYLDTTFYNLTTVALHDWKTYGEMRNLAEEKYGIKLTEVHLPSQTLEQGIDILEIMRNIHIFVAKYSYNLHNQIFVEKQSDSKTLNTITINHISNSIRTHGIGIMNTTVNFIYQFLRQKFIIFSQFLYDDHIKSRLYRDIRYFKESKDQLDNRYPFERAQKFNKEIRKLGLVNLPGDQKVSYLDQFRCLITEIGNAMGYIRMIRSGGFHYVSNAIKFVPDLDDIISFEELASKENLSIESIQSAKNLDSTIDCLSKNFTSGTEYFQMLVNVFTDEFRNPQNIHLKNFFIILPPLTVNFVEHILLGKDKLSKKKSGGFFTDDGFAIGIAYILKLLDQYKQFDSLHWFEEVSHRYNEEMKNIQTQLNKQKKEEQQTAVLTLKKLKSYQMEFELLRFSFDGARIFFKNKEDEMKEIKKENNEANKPNESANNNNNNNTEVQTVNVPSVVEDNGPSSNADAPPPPPPPPI